MAKKGMPAFMAKQMKDAKMKKKPAAGAKAKSKAGYGKKGLGSKKK